MAAPSSSYMISLYLEQYIRPHQGGESNGTRYIGDTPPVTPDVFRKKMSDDLGESPHNPGWPSGPSQASLDAARTIYSEVYDEWVNTDLESDAGITRPDVVKWQTEARTAKP